MKLPLRWIKGFVEVQAYQSKMEQRFSISKVEAIRFLRSLPSNAHSRSTFCVVSAGKGLRLSQVDSDSGVKIGGLERLTLLRDLAPLADKLNIYAHPSGESSEWHLVCGGLSIQLTMTAEPSRGFSGEGQVLSDLTNVDTDQLAKVRSSLKWQSCINMNEIKAQWQLNETSVRQALGMLGSQGLVGYDLGMDSYFHRELPFDVELVESIHPRLINARKLVDNGEVKILKNAANQVEAEVKGTDVTHHVRLGEETAYCTCPWHSKYQGSRGPCKHILAAQLAVGTLADE